MVVKKPSGDRLELDSSIHYIGVLLNHGARVQEIIYLKWRGKTFKIWVEEDDKDWISDFINDVGGVWSGVPMNVADHEDEPVVDPVISPVTKPVMEREIFEEGVNKDFNDNRREAADCVGVSPKIIEEGNQSPNIGQGDEGNGFGNDGGNHCQNLGELKSVKVLKRKKSKKIFEEVGCESGGHYSSSNDRPTKGSVG
ncbi:hypothetical protein Hanom_Chr06g00574761 [Helianthus anomalus]